MTACALYYCQAQAIAFSLAPEQCGLAWRHWEDSGRREDGHPAWFHSHISKTASENLPCTLEHCFRQRGEDRERAKCWCIAQCSWELCSTNRRELAFESTSFRGGKVQTLFGQVFLSSSSLPKVMMWWHFSLPAGCVILSISNFLKKLAHEL